MQNKQAKAIIWLALALPPLSGRTAIDHGIQGEFVNFGVDVSTNVLPMGTLLQGFSTAAGCKVNASGGNSASGGVNHILPPAKITGPAESNAVARPAPALAPQRAAGEATGKPSGVYPGTGVTEIASAVQAVIPGNAVNRPRASGTQGVSSTDGTVTAGTGISVSGSVVSIDPAVVPTFLAASATLDFTSIGPSSCQIVTFPFPGASPGDGVIGGWPADLSMGIVPRVLISATDTVQIQLCNVTTAAIDPPARTYGATVVRGL